MEQTTRCRQLQPEDRMTMASMRQQRFSARAVVQAPSRSGCGKHLGRYAANRIVVESWGRPSSTAVRTVAMLWASRGDQCLRRRLAIRALAISATESSARRVESGRPAPCRLT